MSEVSIGALRLPQTRRARIGEKFAREAVFRMLGKLQVGSLTLHEGPLSHHFGWRAVLSQLARPTSRGTGRHPRRWK
mgnify:CR=1 FL=1